MHRLHEHRQGHPRRPAPRWHRRPDGGHAMTLTHKPSTPVEIGGIGHSVNRHEDDRLIEGQGNFLDDHAAARHAAHGDPAVAGAARADQLDRHVGRDRARRRRRGRHRRAARAVQPRVDADVVGRHAGRARHRQGALPGSGGRGGRRDRSVHRVGRAGADRRRLRRPARRSRRRSSRSARTRC